MAGIIHNAGMVLRYSFIFVVAALNALAAVPLKLPLPPPELRSFFEPPTEFRNDLGSFRSPLMFEDGKRVENPRDWRKRREEILGTWQKIMGPWPELVSNPKAEVVQSVMREKIQQQQLRLQIALGEEWMDALLLLPDGEGPFPAVVVPYYDAETSAGLGEPFRDYGWQLAK